MLKILVFSPNAVENGRGGEISSMELAAGLQKFSKVTFVDTNIFFGKRLLSRRAIDNKLKGVTNRWRLKFANLHILNWNFSFPYLWEVLKLYRRFRENNVFYYSISDIKMNLMFIFYSLINRNLKFIIGYRKPLYSEKKFSIYNLKYRISILLLSLFKKRFYHHTLSIHAKNFLKIFYEPNTITKIVHGIKLDKFKGNEFGKKNTQTLNFIYVGHLIDIPKGVDVLLNGINQFLEENSNLDIFFEFYGVGPLEFKLTELQKKFPKFIKYHGYVGYDEIPECYKRNDVLLFSSRREPFPRVIMEALAANCIILCSRTIGSVEMLHGKDFAIFLNELSPQEIKKNLLEIYRLWKENPSKFVELQKSAKKFVFENYSFTRELKGFKTLINQIIT